MKDLQSNKSKAVVQARYKYEQAISKFKQDYEQQLIEIGEQFGPKLNRLKDKVLYVSSVWKFVIQNVNIVVLFNVLVML